jgi:hypothetical protein
VVTALGPTQHSAPSGLRSRSPSCARRSRRRWSINRSVCGQRDDPIVDRDAGSGSGQALDHARHNGAAALLELEPRLRLAVQGVRENSEARAGVWPFVELVAPIRKIETKTEAFVLLLGQAARRSGFGVFNDLRAVGKTRQSLAPSVARTRYEAARIWDAESHAQVAVRKGFRYAVDRRF